MRIRSLFRFQIAIFYFLALFLTFQPSALFAQGNLIPPGPPAPAMKTLQQIEPRTPISGLPYTILTPGSYYLTTNLTGSSGADGVFIDVDNVTFDLNGFALLGVPGSVRGVIVNPQKNIVIRNGLVQGWGNDGVSAGLASNCRVENLTSVNNYIGIRMGSNGIVRACVTANNTVGINIAQGLVENCTLIGSGNYGLNGSGPCTIKNCVVLNGGGVGIFLGDRAVITGCNISSNNNIGLVLGSAGAVSDTTVALNGGAGIYCGNGALINHSNVASNYNQGILAGSGAAIIGCTASANGVAGIQADAGSRVADCAVFNNGYAGVNVTSNCTVAGCNASSNGFGIGAGTFAVGIYAGARCQITGCNANGNLLDGIVVGDDSLVSGNTASQNGNGATGTSGIYTAGNGSRIDGNHVNRNNLDGISVAATATNNIVVRNSAVKNVGFQFRVPGIPGQAPAGANIVGPIVNDATNSLANAWANFQQP